MRRAVGLTTAALLALVGCSASTQRGEDVAGTTVQTPAPSASASSSLSPVAGSAAGAGTLVGVGATTSPSSSTVGGAKPGHPAVLASACPRSTEPATAPAGQGTPVDYTATGTGSYTTPDGTGVSYVFPPRWTYVWRPSERLVELSATDALGTWGVAADSVDERLSRVSAIYLTAPNGRGGSLTFSLRLAAPLALTSLAPGATARGKAADGSLLVTVSRPASAAAFDIGLRSGPCPESEGIGPGTISLSLSGAQPPWTQMHLSFDVRLEDDQLKGTLDLRKS